MMTRMLGWLLRTRAVGSSKTRAHVAHARSAARHGTAQHTCCRYTARTDATTTTTTHTHTRNAHNTTLLTAQAAPNFGDAVVAEQQHLEARQARKAVEAHDRVVREVDAVELVLCVCVRVGVRAAASAASAAASAAVHGGMAKVRARQPINATLSHPRRHARTCVAPRFSMAPILLPARRCGVFLSVWATARRRHTHKALLVPKLTPQVELIVAHAAHVLRAAQDELGGETAGEAGAYWPGHRHGPPPAVTA